MIKVSIIVPIYNVEKYLKRCLNSLVNQTLKDIEIICIDDCSTDKSYEILQEYAKTDERIIIIKNSENKGIGLARNLGLDIAQGEYIGFVDSDDYIDYDMYEKMYNKAVVNNSDITMCQAIRYQEWNSYARRIKYLIKAISRIKNIELYIKNYDNIDKETLLQSLLIGYCHVWNKIYKKSLLKNNNIKFSDISCFEDVMFTIKANLNANSFSCVNEVLYYYFVNLNGTIISNKNNGDSLLRVIEDIEEYFKNNNLYELFKLNINYFIVNNCYWVFKHLYDMDRHLSTKFLKKAQKKISRKNFSVLIKKINKLKKGNLFAHLIKTYKDNNYKTIEFCGIKIKFKLNKNSIINNIDLVYLWCDISDPIFKKEKEQIAKKMNLHPDANKDCRYINNDELKYSLRSVEKYAPWIKNIYIVTNNQKPEWLNLNHPKIKIIDQSEIMPKEALPNFNSNAIEHCIVNIPDLSEHFLYANDDNFILSKITPEFFFDKKKRYPICRFGRYINNNHSLYRKMLFNSMNLIYKKYGKKYSRFPHHNIDAYRKSDILNCQKIFKKEIEKTIYSPFRTETDIQKSVYCNYSMAIKHAYFKEVKSIDSYLPWYRKIINNLFHIYEKDSIDIGAHRKKIIDVIIKYKPKLFCINDTENATDDDRIRVKKFLDCYFPYKSSFEK